MDMNDASMHASVNNLTSIPGWQAACQDMGCLACLVQLELGLVAQCAASAKDDCFQADLQQKALGGGLRAVNCTIAALLAAAARI